MITLRFPNVTVFNSTEVTEILQWVVLVIFSFLGRLLIACVNYFIVMFITTSNHMDEEATLCECLHAGLRITAL